MPDASRIDDESAFRDLTAADVAGGGIGRPPTRAPGLAARALATEPSAA